MKPYTIVGKLYGRLGLYHVTAESATAARRFADERLDTDASSVAVFNGHIRQANDERDEAEARFARIAEQLSEFPPLPPLPLFNARTAFYEDARKDFEG